jgi:cell wall-associated NlpC family hydrolase
MRSRLFNLAVSVIIALGIIGFQSPTAQASPVPTQAFENVQIAQEVKSAQARVGGYWYTVRSGNTLSGIAYRVYGSAGQWVLIYNANRTRISNPNLIYVGQRIYLPVLGSASVIRTVSTVSTVSTRARTVINYALAQRGKQYCWGGSGPYCFDCSGLVMASFLRIGIRLPHQSGSMLRYGTRISRSQLRPGDIVWPQYGHVAIYLGNNRIIHASNPRTDVLVSSLYGFYAARRVIR